MRLTAACSSSLLLAAALASDASAQAVRYRIPGGSAFHSRGLPVERLDDVDGDGAADFGRDGRLLFQHPGEEPGGEHGVRVEVLGDVDGDRAVGVLASGLFPSRVLALSFAPTPRLVPRSRLAPR